VISCRANVGRSCSPRVEWDVRQSEENGCMDCKTERGWARLLCPVMLTSCPGTSGAEQMSNHTLCADKHTNRPTTAARLRPWFVRNKYTQIYWGQLQARGSEWVGFLPCVGQPTSLTSHCGVLSTARRFGKTQEFFFFLFFFLSFTHGAAGYSGSDPLPWTQWATCRRADR
jgi:hypothetical protein